MNFPVIKISFRGNRANTWRYKPDSQPAFYISSSSPFGHNLPGHRVNNNEKMNNFNRLRTYIKKGVIVSSLLHLNAYGTPMASQLVLIVYHTPALA